MQFKQIAIVLSTYISFISCAVHFEGIYGVADEELGKYQKTPDGLFHCLDGNGVIPYSALNDDYCDCADGSDEPGTSACQNSRFYCENHGSKGHYIPSSRVNDGICDYDLCCDGSDEYNGFVECPDKCEEISKKEESKRKEKLIEIYNSFHNRQLMLSKSNANITLDNKLYEEKKVLIEEKNKEFEDFKVRVKELEKIEKESKDVYKSMFRELRSKYKSSQQRLKKAIEDLLEIKNNNLDKDSLNNILSNYNEDLLMEFVKPNAKKEEETNNTEAGNDEQSTENVSDENSNENDTEETVVVDEDEEEEKRIAEEKEQAYKALRTQLSKLRVERNDLEREIKSIKKEMEEIDLKRNMENGNGGIYYTLYNEKFTLETTDYIYTFYWGKEIKQKQKKGSLTLLGKFKEFKEGLKSVVYDEGVQCWQGPKRSVIVNLICHPENTIIKIDEPSKCEYVMEFGTPGACEESDLYALTENDDEIDNNPEFSEEMINSIKEMLKENPEQLVLDEDEVLEEDAQKIEEENPEEKQEEGNDDNTKHDEL